MEKKSLQLTQAAVLNTRLKYEIVKIPTPFTNGEILCPLSLHYFHDDDIDDLPSNLRTFNGPEAPVITIEQNG